MSKTCPNCGNHYDPAEHDLMECDPIFFCSRQRNPDSGSITRKYECFACGKYYTETDYPDTEAYTIEILGRAAANDRRT